MPQTPHLTTDMVMIGGGIMSATLTTLLTELNPDMQIDIFERLGGVGLESSNTLNNAGTGHAGMCELHYNPELPDGTVDVSKSNKIIEPFEVSKQFWAYLIENKLITPRHSLINTVPHISVVFGEDNVRYLRKRWQTIQTNILFQGMEYSEDHATIAKRAPLLIAGRDPNEKIAASRMMIGTDVNFGDLTRAMMHRFDNVSKVTVHHYHEVQDLQQLDNGLWQLMVRNTQTGEVTRVHSKQVFVGAGGQAIPLLEKAGIPQAKQFAGFPVGAQWLICTNQDIIDQHHAKVYGRPSVDAPPMSVAHLDTRIINGKKALMFGPYAEFTTKFLRQGSVWDLFRSLRWHNIQPLIQVGRRNLGLTKYLIKQSLQSQQDRLRKLRAYMPSARDEDWKLAYAGKRVQIIKNIPGKGGTLQFGTEVVVSEDQTLSALLGASPGASTAVSIMLELLAEKFPQQMNSPARQAKIKQMIPSYGQLLSQDAQLAHQVRSWSHQVLGLHDLPIATDVEGQLPGIRMSSFEQRQAAQANKD